MQVHTAVIQAGDLSLTCCALEKIHVTFRHWTFPLYVNILILFSGIFMKIK